MSDTPLPDSTASLSPSASRVSRRSALAAAAGWMLRLGVALLAAVTGLWSAAILRFLVPNANAELPTRFTAGEVADFPPGKVDARFKDAHGVWIVRGAYRGRGQIYALRTRCTHLGCITLWQENQRKFKCPCHGSGFRLDGINVEGPAPRPLERCAIGLTPDGKLEVDCSLAFREELGQWSDPRSFVDV